MTNLNRREFSKILGAAGAAATATSAIGSMAYAQGAGKVVIVGGGAGGGTVAHLVKKGSPKLDVTLIEVQPKYTTCFFSNLYIGGFRTFDSITHNYDGLKKLGVKVIHDWATDVDAAKKTVTLKSGTKVPYDKLVLSPGIDFKYETIKGYSPAAAEKMPHAWKAGVQTQILKKQLTDMPDGGVVIMAPPTNPFRCPPGPYERASMICHYLKNFKPKSKLVILDPKPKFSKMALFMEGFNGIYKDFIEIHLTTELDNFGVVSVDPATNSVETAGGLKMKGAVCNIIPAQRAGSIAAKAGCTDGDWCPINPGDFSSKKVKDIYVLGDASIAKKMPKSGFSANSQAKVVANAVQAALAGKKKFPARFRNTCWSLVSPDNGIKVGASYAAGGAMVEVKSKFISKPGEDKALRAQTYKESLGWYDSITGEMFAKG